MEAFSDCLIKHNISSTSVIEALIAAPSDFVQIVDKNFVYIYSSQTTAQAIGVEPHKMVGKSWRQLDLPAANMERLESVWSEVIVSDEIRTGTWPELFARGGYYHYICRPLRDEAGQVQAVLSIFHYVSGEMRLEPHNCPSTDYMLYKSEEQYKLLFNNFIDIVFLHKILDGRRVELIEANDAAFKTLGYSRQQLFDIKTTQLSTSTPAEVAVLINKLSLHKDVRFETNLRTQSGAILPVDVNSRLFNLAGQMVVLSIVRDMSERRALEEKIKFISERDKLTGAYNRAYFEENITSYYSQDILPQGVIICDVDGLKIINDTLGHHYGDRLIVSAVRIIEQAVEDQGMIARIGGDEFIIVVDAKAKLSVAEVYNRLKDKLEQHNQEHPLFPVRMSGGYSDHIGRTNFAAMLKAADDNMYKDKLMNKGNFANVTVEALRAKLSEKDEHVESHSNRLQSMIADFGKSLDLTESSITNLRLLAKLHDIGKTAIPRHILNKKETLTEEEWSEIRRHPEVGYRICKALPELIPVPEWVLKHHERWDGNGYPLGLKGEEIPMESRILAILDAYDAMTNERPYRMALSRDQALAEIRKQAGAQFDPTLVEKFLALIGRGQGSVDTLDIA